MDVADDVTKPERRDDQRRVGFDVRAHHENVARFKRRVVVQHAQHHLAERVDLSGGTVAAVDLHRAVVVAELSRAGADFVGADVGLQPTQQGVGSWCGADEFVGVAAWQAALHFAKIAAEGVEQRMVGPVAAGVVLARHGLVDVGERLPQVVARVRQPQVQVVVGGQRLEQFDVGGWQVQPEHAKPLGQVGRAFPQPGERLCVPDVWGVGVDALDECPPQVGLPLQVLVEAVADAVGGLAVEPVDEHLWPLASVGREQTRQPACHRIAATSTQFGFVAGVEVAQMRCERSAPVVVAAGVDGVQQWPGHRVRRPGIVVNCAGDLGDQRCGGAERHPGAHSVGAVAPPEHVGESLAQPPLHAARRHQHQFLGERVGQGIGQQRTEPVGEEVGAISTMEVERHWGPR